MKIIKTTDRPSCKALVKTGSDEKSEMKVMSKITDFFGENKKRAIVIACSVLMIGSAVLLNWKLFGPDDNTVGGTPETTVPESTSENVGNIPETS